MQPKKNIARVHPLTEPIRAQINIPGSKSYTNRALIIASLAEGVSTLSGYSRSNDSFLLIKILKRLGVGILLDGNTITVKGDGGKFKEFNGKINVEDAGTAMRFLTALCCLIPGEIILEGSQRMHQRPIKGLVDALLQLGVNITYLGESGFPPIKIKGGNLHGGKVAIDASLSSQFISALMMIAPSLPSGLEITVTGEIASTPYIDMSISVMKHFGASIEQKPGKYFIKGGSAYTSANYIIEGDASSASYFFALAALTQSTIRVKNLSPSSLQGDVMFVNLLEQIGCKVVKAENYIEVSGTKELCSISVDMKDMPDVAQTLAMVAAFAKGKTILTGLKNLEIKETKRLTAIQKELTKIGIACESDGEQITIQGGNPKGALIHTYNDHRMAMAFAIAGARVKGLFIESPEVVKKSFPDFWNTLKEIGVKVDIEKAVNNIVVIGFMGAGKTTISKLLGNKSGLKVIETDDEIIKRSGFESVKEIFDKKGETYFREIENKVIADCAGKSNCIISCGGGVIANIENVRLLKESGKIIFLSASFETILKRLKHQDSRPLFNHGAKELYQKRLPLYKSCADKIIVTDSLKPEEVAEQITLTVFK